MTVELIDVAQPQQVALVAALAKEIWNEHYLPLIGPEQVAYMVEKFQSESALQHQMAEEDYCYFLVQAGEKVVGYTGVQCGGGRLFLSKLYFKKEARGNGYARQVLSFLEEHARKDGLRSIWLTVNKQNTSSIEAYRAMGFVATQEQISSIGEGYVMDDYIMEKVLR